MSADRESAWLYLGKTEAEGADYDLPQGLVSVRTIRSPDKETANEDAAAVIPVGDQALVLAVADGVGGTPAGREASNQAVKALRATLTKIEPLGGNLRAAILDALEKANRSLLEASRGAATTLVIGEISGGHVRSYHVGDSELISVGQRGRIKLRLTPHSPTGFAVEAGLMDEDEAVQHDQRHVLFNVIGAPTMRIEVGTPVRLDPRDTLLLATDGLLDNLFVDEIIETIRTGPLPEVADRLVAQARERMTTEQGNKPSKPDDLTVILFRRPVPRKRKR